MVTTRYPLITLMVVATSTLDDKIRIMVRATVDMIQVKQVTKCEIIHESPS